MDSKLRRGLGEVAAVPVHGGLEEPQLEGILGVLQRDSPGEKSLHEPRQGVAKLAKLTGPVRCRRVRRHFISIRSPTRIGPLLERILADAQ